MDLRTLLAASLVLAATLQAGSCVQATLGQQSGDCLVSPKPFEESLQIAKGVENGTHYPSVSGPLPASTGTPYPIQPEEAIREEVSRQMTDRENCLSNGDYPRYFAYLTDGPIAAGLGFYALQIGISPTAVVELFYKDNVRLIPGELRTFVELEDLTKIGDDLFQVVTTQGLVTPATPSIQAGSPEAGVPGNHPYELQPGSSQVLTQVLVLENDLYKLLLTVPSA